MTCEKKRINKGDTCWWKKEAKKAISRKKDAHKVMYQNSAEEGKSNKSIKNRVKKAVSKAT